VTRLNALNPRIRRCGIFAYADALRFPFPHAGFGRGHRQAHQETFCWNAERFSILPITGASAAPIPGMEANPFSSHMRSDHPLLSRTQHLLWQRWEMPNITANTRVA